jgi:glycosyltransferase involved in cell wall biosynthesis
MKQEQDLKVAIVHDWLVGGGAERVVYELHQMFPDAPIYTSYATKEWRKKLDGKVVTGYLQHWPFSALRKVLPLLRIGWFSQLDLSGYNLIISSSGNGEAKSIQAPEGATHICYCHSPVHFYWRHFDQYLRRPGFGIFNPIVRLSLRILVAPLRTWDYRTAQRPDYFIANSTHIQADIKRYYERDAVVIYPPVDVERFQRAKSDKKRQGFITVGRQVPHKRTDLIVQACTRLDVPLTVIGKGPEHNKLVKMAGPKVTFLSHVSDADLPKHIVAAEAFVFASHEDFGITPVEAIATGTPVIAFRGGGALDYVESGKTGEFFSQQTVSSLKRALQRFSPAKYSSDDIKARAKEFQTTRFRKSISKFIKDSLQ